MQKVSKKRAQEIAEGCECDQDPESDCSVACCKNCGLFDQCADVCHAFVTSLFEGKPQRDTDGGFIVVKDGQVLSPKASQKLINHSPNGFNWSYGGSGPAQLALALLLDVTGDKEVAQRWYQDFKWQVVAGLDRHWRITGDEIKQWLIKEGANVGAE